MGKANIGRPAAQAIVAPRPRNGMRAKERHLLHVMPSFDVGGIQVRLARTINRLGGRYRHTLVAIDGRVGARSLLNCERIAFRTAPRPTFLDPLALLSCARAIRATAPDLLITYNWGSVDWAMANRLGPRLRHVHFEDGFGPEEADRQFLRRRVYRRIALRRAAAVVVPSHKLETIAASAWGVAARRIRYVANGVDAERFIRPALPAHPAALRRPGETLVGTVAPLRPEKNVARLIRAFASVAGRFSTRLIIAGEGAERPGLETLARQLGLGDRVVFVGHVAAPETVLQALDVFAMTSQTEQMPLSLLEAMASGLPVLATDVGDIGLIVAEENRRYVIARDDEARLAIGLGELIADPVLRRQLGAQNRARVLAEYREEFMIANLDAIFAL